MSTHVPHFPTDTLTFNGNLIVAAAAKYPAVTGRLPGNYINDTTALIAKMAADLVGQKNAKGETSQLTQTQQANLNQLLHWMNQARTTAKLAFPGQTVKLHQEFQVGVHDKHDLGSVLGRADIILASIQNAENLPTLKLKGWTDAETSTFLAVRATFPATTQTQQSGKGGAKQATALKNADAANLYEHLLAIQNAANLQYPAIDPANVGIRDEFRLNTFPPTNHAPAAPAPTPTPAPTPILIPATPAATPATK
jgi:hypothetical protein